MAPADRVLARATLCLNAALLTSVVWLEWRWEPWNTRPLPVPAREHAFLLESHSPPEEGLAAKTSTTDGYIGVAGSPEAWRKAIQQRFLRRKQRALASCGQSDLHPDNEQLTRSRSLYYASKYSLVVCATAKAAATTWKTHLLRMNGVKEPYLPTPHVPKFNRKIHAQTLLGDASLKKVLASREATRVMVARHPLSRLVSAYQDKFQGGISPPLLPAWVKYMKKYCHGCERHNRTMTFSQFLTAILREKNATGVEKLNAHWRPYSTTCSPCSIHYDFIFKQETFEDDLRFLSQFLRVEEVQVCEKSHGKNDTFLSSYMDYYKDVPPPLLRHILNLYEPDFRMFDYRLPNITNINMPQTHTQMPEA